MKDRARVLINRTASVVTRNVPAGMVFAGNPAKIIGRVTDLADRLKREGVWKPMILA